jgi:DNA repair exonuclease SbcCD nuclease subunit
MRVAVTADLHLRESNPERLENLEVLIQQLLSREIHLLIIAGDLFDAADKSYAQFDSLAQRLPDIRLLIVPGNHDPDLRRELFASDNIQVFARPTLKRIDQRLFLFLPYREGSTIGETISALQDSEGLRSHPWILVSHGDFTAPRREENGREGGYFPLTREDLARFKPAKVILGHIHVPNSTTGEVVYPGSPYPITSDEYGQRRVLILETKSASIDELPLTHPPVQVRAEVFLIPDGREEEQTRRQLESILAEQEPSGNLVVKAVIKGYSASRRKAQGFVEAYLSERGIPCTGIDLEPLRVNDQENLATLAEAVRQRVERLQLEYGEAEELRQEVLEKALAIVYGA